MQKSKQLSYTENCGWVENTVEYCPVHTRQLGRAMEISQEAHELLWEATRGMHTKEEVSGPRW